MFAPKKCLLITINILDHILKLCLELTKLENDNAMEKFYLMQIIFEGSHFGQNLKKFKKFQKLRKYLFLLMSCSTSCPSGNQVDGSPLVAIPNRGELA